MSKIFYLFPVLVFSVFATIIISKNQKTEVNENVSLQAQKTFPNNNKQNIPLTFNTLN
jgi:hypothetical protein